VLSKPVVRERLANSGLAAEDKRIPEGQVRSFQGRWDQRALSMAHEHVASGTRSQTAL
jgi:hypothetical protein